MRVSIRRAAAEAGARLALIADQTRWTFADLARAARQAPEQTAFVATRSAATVAAIAACFERRAPMALLHPKDTAEAHRRCRAAAREPLPDTAAVLFTSGSSGAPKAVALAEAAFVASAAASAENLGWHADDRWLCSLPLAHIGGLSIITRSLLARRCVVLDTREGFDAAHTAALLETERVTLWSAVPTMLERLLAHDAQWRPPEHLRAVLVGGAALSPGLLERATSRGLPLVPSYGMTETCSQICAHAPGAATEASSGRPLRGVDIRIDDDGIIAVRSPTLMLGYLGQPSPIANGWFRTGDRGRLDATGALHVHGRADDTIITGGENVDPGVVEPVLAGFPGIDSAVVFGIDDEKWGEVVAAAVVSDSLDREALRSHLAAALAPHQRPRRIAVLDALPFSKTGKVDRRAARDAARHRLLPV